MDDFCSSCAARAMGSSFGCLVPCRMSRRMSCCSGDMHDLCLPTENAIVVHRTAIFRHLPKASACFRHSCRLLPSSVTLPHLPTTSAASVVFRRFQYRSVALPHLLLSSAAPNIDPLSSDTFRPIVRSRKSRFRNELFPYVHTSLMPRHRRLVLFRAAAVV